MLQALGYQDALLISFRRKKRGASRSKADFPGDLDTIPPKRVTKQSDRFIHKIFRKSAAKKFVPRIQK